MKNMIKNFLLLSLCLLFFSSPLYANNALITNITIVDQNENLFEYEPIFRNKVPFKYLLSDNAMFKIEGENLTGYNYKGSLIIQIGQEEFESLVYDPRSSEKSVYFNIDSIRDKIIELDAESFKFQFCPNGIYNSDCTDSSIIEIIKDDNISNDTFSSFQYYLEDSNIVSAKKAVEINHTPIIAVIDDGISIQHADLMGQNWVNIGEINGNGIDDDNNGYIDDYYGWNFIDANNLMFPKGDHGTNVAGIISAVTDNELGIAGISNNSQLMSLIGCDEDGCSNESIISSITYAVDNGANIINLSIGGQWFNYDNGISDAISYANGNNVIVVISLGNGDILTGNGLNTSDYKISPVCNETEESQIIGVSALSIYSDLSKGGLLTSWTNYGDCADVYAYGESIVTLTRDGSYDILDGTSFSAPIITGIIALGYNQYGGIDRKLVHDALTKSKNIWHGIDTVKYLDELQKNIELAEEGKMNDIEMNTTQINIHSELYNKLDVIEQESPGTLKTLLPLLQEIKYKEKYKAYTNIINVIIEYIEFNY